MVGKGCPDILVGKNGRLFLMEIKDGSKAPSARKLTDDEELWHTLWHDMAVSGALIVVESVAEALAAIEKAK
jgi:hypothetical protein